MRGTALRCAGPGIEPSMKSKKNLSPVSGFIVVLILVTVTVALSGCGGIGISAQSDSTPTPTPTPTPGPNPTPTPVPTPTPTPTPPPSILSVNHVIIMLQENRSFDSYFGKITEYRAAQGIPGTVDDLDSGKFSNSGIAPYHSGSVCMENLSPDWAEMRHELNLSHPSGVVPGDKTTMPMNGFVNTASGIAVFYNFIDTIGKRAMGYYTE